MSQPLLPVNTKFRSIETSDGCIKVQETKLEKPPLPAKNRFSPFRSSLAFDSRGSRMTAPSLPPKKIRPLTMELPSNSNNSFKPCFAPPNLLDQTPPSPRSPASFMNPLYVSSHSNVTTPLPEIQIVPVTNTTPSNIEESRPSSEASSNSFPLTEPKDNSDTDSIYFLEKNTPALTKMEQYRRRASLNSIKETITHKRQMDHEYEICELQESPTSNKTPSPNINIGNNADLKKVDIFDLVSFKSPLYGSLPTELEHGSSSKQFDDLNEDPVALTYDIPSFLPPAYPPPPLPAMPPRRTSNGESPRIPPRTKPPPVPQRSTASLPNDADNLVMMTDSMECHIYEAGPRDEPPAVQMRNKNSDVVQQVTPPVSKVPVSKAPVSKGKLANSTRMSSVEEVQLCGYLYTINNNGKDLQKKWISLEGSRLCYYKDSKASSPDLQIPTKSIIGVTIVHSQCSSHSDSKISELWCFRIFIRDGNHWFLGAGLPSERLDWVSQLSLVIAPTVGGILPATLTGIFGVGEVMIKEGISGSWQRGFVICYHRILNLLIGDESLVRRINLQQVSAVAKESSRLSCATAAEPGLVFHLNLPQQVLYLQADWSIYTESLMEIIQQLWILPPKAGLADQYLTTENVPVIVDKCLKFISTHGTMLEGIYRLSGSSTKVRQLLESFTRDVWDVHLKLDEYSPHDVASAFKRYLRTLPECLLTEKQFLLWGQNSLIENKNERVEAMLHLLSHLPDVNYQTLKKLIGHLCIVTEHSDRNLMPAINLAPVFGPTLLYRASIEMENESYDASTVATDIVADLITHYSRLFKVQPQEMEKERKIILAVQKMKDARLLQKPAGDILIGVYIYSKDWGKCINMKLTPSTTARDVCEYAISIGNVREPIGKITLMEVVCDGELERPLHYTESVLPVTMRWLTWGQDEAKGNYILVKHNSIYDTVLPIVSLQNGQALSVFGDISYADASTKSFKKYSFEFTRAKLKIYKMSKSSSQSSIGEWNIEEIVWYLGADSKRSTPTKWTFSFMDKKTAFKRSKSQPYFGSTVCCKTEDELHKLIAAMLIGEHPQGLLPNTTLPDLLS